MKNIAIAALVSVLSLAACTSLSKSDCEEGNWQAIGQRDGVKGRDALFISRQIESCTKHGITVDDHLWEKGRQEGLQVFCTPESQYELGRSGRAFNQICAVENLPEHRAAYEKGRNYHRLTQRIRHLRAELSDYPLYGIPHPSSSDASIPLLDAMRIRLEIDRLLRQRQQYEFY